jgi:plastocyanin
VHSLVGFGLTSSSLRTFFAVFFRADKQSVSNNTETPIVKKKEMKAKNLVTIAAVSAALSFSLTAQAKEEKHEEQTTNNSDVPAAVQQAAKAEAKGGSIIRWEKEGANYEAVIQKKGKQIGVEMDANGKVLSKHNEAKEHKEKGEKY